MRVDPLQILTKLAAVQNIPTRRVTPPFEGLEEFDYGLRRSLDPQFDWQEFGQLLLDSTPENTLLLVEGTFELHFALFLATVFFSRNFRKGIFLICSFDNGIILLIKFMAVIVADLIFI